MGAKIMATKGTQVEDVFFISNILWFKFIIPSLTLEGVQDFKGWIGINYKTV